VKKISKAKVLITFPFLVTLSNDSSYQHLPPKYQGCCRRKEEYMRKRGLERE